MNEIVNHFLLAGFTKNKERMQKIKEKKYSQYIHQSKLDKACFQHDMAYEYFKDLTRRTASDKLLRDKLFNFAKNPKYDAYQRQLISLVYRFFDKKKLLVVVLKMKIFQTKN